MAKTGSFSFLICTVFGKRLTLHWWPFCTVLTNRLIFSGWKFGSGYLILHVLPHQIYLFTFLLPTPYYFPALFYYSLPTP